VITVRRPAVLFALVSAFYWEAVTELWRTITLLNYSYLEVLLVSTLPAMLYAAVALWFCGWLARRVIRQIAALRAPAEGQGQ
jgi:hypothetical protein